MHVNLEVSISDDYFSRTEREIDWDEDDDTKISIKQAGELQKILATEVSIYLLRRATGFCGSLIDTMAKIRREQINQYEKTYEPYVEYNNYY